ncbi:hypothetical protein ABT039_22250 [Streptomyces lasiicapitis]|uniref:hypothetical protein n=1 Tax=Streptomyces lasiicapitis TaxID=1923961 RepID=UPI00331F7605
MADDGPDAPAAEPEHPMIVLLRRIEALAGSLDQAEAAAAKEGRVHELEVHADARMLLASVEKLTVRQVAEVANHGAYHWALTVTGTVAGRQTLLSDHGVIRPTADDTRQSLCDRLVTTLCTESEQTTGKPYLDAKVLFFDLQPNSLPRPAP